MGNYPGGQESCPSGELSWWKSGIILVGNVVLWGVYPSR